VLGLDEDLFPGEPLEGIAQGLFAFTAMAVLIAVIMVGYLYAWKKKVLEWK
jgi:NADH:ubiquinone oxidoreductase subunit 3 (subunit A)